MLICASNSKVTVSVSYFLIKILNMGISVKREKDNVSHTEEFDSELRCYLINS